jgi:hypothetical protein
MPQTYEFHFGDPGLFVEVYLPKKAEYQGALYKALTNGFNLALVQEHLRSNKTKVQSFLRRLRRVANYSDEQVDQLTAVYQGYSMYEVDGVFNNGTPTKPHLYEERTQIVRLMFVPPSDTEPFASRQFLRHWTHDLARFESEVGANIEGGDLGAIARDRLVKWLDDISLYINGYILFTICDSILRLFEEDRIAKVEDEVWVTSLRCLAVNRVKATRE